MTPSSAAPPSAPAFPTSHRYEEIDVLRGFAALWVVVSHYLPFWNRYLGTTYIIVPNLWGQYAVWLFFVISGFVIFSTLDKARTVGEFALLRSSRLYPAYWATLLFSTFVSVALLGKEFWLHGFLANITMFQEFLGYPNADNVYWSLTVELTFYLNAAWLFALGLHKRPQLVAMVWLGIACVWALTIHQRGISHDHRDFYAFCLVLDFSPYFAMGMIFYDAVKNGWSASRWALIAFALFDEGLITGWWGLRAALIIAPLFFLAINGYLKILVNKTTLWLGGISYSLYLVHRNLGYSTMPWLHQHHIGPAIAVPITIAIALTLATIVTHGIERPAMRNIRARYARQRQNLAAVCS